MANSGESTLIPAPAYACEPVESAVRIMHTEIEESGGPNSDPSTNNGITTMAANLITSTCAKLCTDGCIRDLHFRTEAADLELPPSREREMLFDLVSATLATEFIDQVLKEDEVPQGQAVEYELPTVTGDELREIVEARLGVFEDTELLERVSKAGKYTIEQIQEVMKDTITPIREDVYDDLAVFTGGNIRAALAIVAYFQEVFYKFRSSEPEAMHEAAVISELGFRPGNPWEITSIDIQTIATLTHENGMIELPTSAYGATCFYINDDPSTMKIFQKTDGELVEVKPNTLPIPTTGR